MATAAQEKKPGEIIALAADFADALASVPGDTLVGGQPEVVITNALTDAVATGTILVPSSVAINGTVVECAVQAGADGDRYDVLFKSGNTSAGKRYESTLQLVVTDYPASDNILISRDEAKLLLGIDADDDSENALVDTLIMSASEYMRRRCRRDFQMVRKRVEIIRPEENVRRLRLEHFPLFAVTKVIRRYADGGAEEEFTDSSYWAIDDTGYVWWVQQGLYWYQFPDENEIHYRAGMDRIPDDLKRACGGLVNWFHGLVASQGMKAEKISDYAYTRANLSDFPPGVRMELPDAEIEGIIARYRRYDLFLQ